MASKLRAARLASERGVDVVIASGMVPGTLGRLTAGGEEGTWVRTQAPASDRRRRIVLAGERRADSVAASISSLEIVAVALVSPVLVGNLLRLGPRRTRGLDLFLGRANCGLCHSGPNFSDGEFHNNALPTIHGGEARDPGRFDGARVVASSPFNAAGPHSDQPDGPAALRVRQLRQSSESWGEFRTPSLRNLGRRAPFMHQGQLPDLASVIEFYSELTGATGRGHHQEQVLAPLRLSVSEKADLEAFLLALEGEQAPQDLLSPPSRSVSGR